MCVCGGGVGVVYMPSDDWRGEDISEHHEGLVCPVMQPLMPSSALSAHTGMFVCVEVCTLNAAIFKTYHL